MKTLHLRTVSRSDMMLIVKTAPWTKHNVLMVEILISKLQRHQHCVINLKIRLEKNTEAVCVTVDIHQKRETIRFVEIVYSMNVFLAIIGRHMAT